VLGLLIGRILAYGFLALQPIDYTSLMNKEGLWYLRMQNIHLGDFHSMTHFKIFYSKTVYEYQWTE
jgi:hypothetical protein